MAIRPVFERAPLLSQERAMLRMTQSDFLQEERRRAAAWVETALPEMAGRRSVSRTEAQLLEAAVLLGGKAGERAMAWLRQAAQTQPEDLDQGSRVALAQAALAAFGESGERPMLVLAADLLSGLDIRDALAETSGAELMAALTELYLLAGRKAALTLCQQVRAQAFDWVSALRTLRSHKPWREAGAPTGDEDFDTLQRRCYDAQELADGVRFTVYAGRITGNGTALSAAELGWSTLHRAHGQAAGGLSADPYLEGASPYEGQDTAALCAWAEALALCVVNYGAAWAAEALERIAVNALPAVLGGSLPRRRFAVNGEAEAEYADLHTPEGAQLLWRLARALRACAGTVVMMTPGGAELRRLIEGACRLPLAGRAAALTLRREPAAEGEETWVLGLRGVKQAEISLRVCVPAWAENARIIWPDGQEQPAAAGESLSLERMCEGGEVLRLQLRRALRVETGYHQAAAVYDGPVLMAVPALVSAGMAAVVEPQRQDGQVQITLRPVADKPRKAGVPVLPQTVGDPMRVAMTPFRAGGLLNGMLPRGRQA